ncbi:DUF4179 domain-containing protein [Pseudalkalibacillus berkeleyi]|uniref:DUF4179 domain-containing protein n=1 Tax=Pseudalkalibacillus berkeleyi TaxID=1069813 RepID=A0ABS9H0E8_9BACL|nr:DUF4179 domain-containing protein [Pseudalkalibacillus berkeleyi]MCF6138414.1 DUF4179 domain-containing protein [Pseudalkalibacillus berkeleyi]
MENKHIQTPERIDEYIKSGIQKGKRHKKIRSRAIVSTMSSIALIFLLVTSIKVSPAFANTLKSIPGIESIIEMIEGDKGLEDAVVNDFIHEVNVSQTHEGIKVSVDRIIVDESRMILFYSIEASNQYTFLRLHSPDLLNEDGEELHDISYSYNDPSENVNFAKGEKMEGKIVINLTENAVVPNTLILNTRLEETDSATSTTGTQLGVDWNLKIPIDKEWFKNTKETIPIHKEISIEGQKVQFEKMVIHPTRIGLYVKLDQSNTKQLFHFDDLKLVDEKGEHWLPIDNGVTRTGGENDYVLYFQSNYFRKPAELYLSGSSVRAIPKGERTIVIDVRNEKLVKAPRDNRITLDGVTKLEDNVQLDFSVKYEQIDKHAHYELFRHTPVNMEVNGQEMVSSDDSLVRYHHYSIQNPTNQKEVILKLIDYPNRITEPFKIKIK